ncbi:MAG: hypothetical protein ACI81L_002185 [Verrucomicrobiales bacterium]|jgi:hypothetical protein
MNVPPIVRCACIARPVDETFDVFTAEIGAWWPLPTHGLFGGDAASVVFRDGKLIEQSIDGREVEWGEVSAWEPSRRVVIAWHPGRDRSEASEVEVLFEEDRIGTRVVIEHRGWEVFGDDANGRRLGYVGPNAWGYVLDHFASGAEIDADAVDLDALSAAYESFFSEAEIGGFDPPPGAEWNAEQVVAHVALNDAAMMNTCQALVHGLPTRFENVVCQEQRVLDGWIAASGDMAGLVRRGRVMARSTRAALRRLSAEQRETDVHCRLIHDGHVMVNNPMAWELVAITTQIDMHLPAHITQLRDLRPAGD